MASMASFTSSAWAWFVGLQTSASRFWYVGGASLFPAAKDDTSSDAHRALAGVQSRAAA